MTYTFVATTVDGMFYPLRGVAQSSFIYFIYCIIIVAINLWHLLDFALLDYARQTQLYINAIIVVMTDGQYNMKLLHARRPRAFFSQSFRDHVAFNPYLIPRTVFNLYALLLRNGKCTVVHV